jgi:WhiB family redox-sensing transcriptional regulator
MSKPRKRVSLGTPVNLPPQNIDNWKWQFDAACRDEDNNLFYYQDQERGDQKASRIKAAKAICASCPVSTACLEWATRTKETHGIWGGLTPEERGIKMPHEELVD